MPTESTKCQFIDPSTKNSCESWYEYEEGQKFCPNHRYSQIQAISDKNKEVNHIPRTAKVISDEEIQKINTKIFECSQMSIPELADHIRSIEEQIRILERDRRAANMAKRNMEDKLTDEERQASREASAAYGRVPTDRPSRVPRKSPEEKAKNRKDGFPAWAARLGLKVEELMVMDDDEMASRIAKYRASKAGPN